LQLFQFQFSGYAEAETSAVHSLTADCDEKLLALDHFIGGALRDHEP
jgi:hypothetical protein